MTSWVTIGSSSSIELVAPRGIRVN
jgi:hypothetical protein